MCGDRKIIRAIQPGGIILWLLAANVLNAQPGDRFYIQKLNGPVTIDGKIDEPAWDAIEPLPLVSHWPAFGDSPEYETELRIAYDEEHLYVSCRCFMEPEQIRSTTYRRNSLGMHMDFVSVVLDTFNDKENAVQFAVTPSGSRTDVVIFNDGQGDNPTDWSWDTFWDAETVISDTGWTVEMRIPFSSLRFENTNGRVEMGLLAFRYNASDVSLYTFPAIPPNWGFWSFIKPSQYQPVVFDNIQNRNPVYVTPYLLGGLQRTAFLDSGDDSFSHDRDFYYDAGLDLKMGLTNNVTLDLTVNTDFAQVEDDDEQLNLTRFSLFFPERRQFFLERASIFDFSFGESDRLFYSRRVGLAEDGRPVRIIGGARMIAHTRGWDIGLISMQTARYSENPTENFSTFRFRRQIFNPQSYAGGMVTGRFDEKGSYNAAFGLDGIFNLIGDDFLNINLANTVENDLNLPFLHHETLRFQTVLERRTFSGINYQLSYNYAGSQYHPGTGFQLRENYMAFGDRISYGWQTVEGPLQQIQASLNGSLFLKNDDRSLETFLYGPSFEVTWKRGDLAIAGFQFVTEDILQNFSLSDEVQIPAGRYHFREATATYHTPRGRGIRAVLNASGGGFFDGRRFTASIQPELSLSRVVQLDLFYELNKISFKNRNQHLTAHIARIRTEFTFNTKTTFSAFVQYNTSLDLSVMNLRFRYNPKDGNNFYLVLNETLNSNRGRTFPALPLSDNRMVLLKYNYTFGF